METLPSTSFRSFNLAIEAKLPLVFTRGQFPRYRVKAGVSDGDSQTRASVPWMGRLFFASDRSPSCQRP
jgi:hypothetical protein